MTLGKDEKGSESHQRGAHRHRWSQTGGRRRAQRETSTDGENLLQLAMGFELEANKS